MTGDSASSPKRRRVDDAAPTATQVAQTNATLHQFLGQRMNRWMQPQPSSTSSLAQSNRKAASAVSPPAEHAGVAPCPPLSGPRSSISATKLGPTPALANPVSTAGIKADVQLGLPSPAPSDDYAYSPDLNQRPPAAGVSAFGPWPARPVASLRPPLPPPPPLRRDGPAPSASRNRAHAATPVLPSSDASVSASQPQPPAPLPPHQSQHPSSDQPAGSPQSLGSQQPPPTAPPPARDTQHSPPRNPYHPAVMMQKIDVYCSRNPPSKWNPFDSGRLALLRDAVARADHFFLVLHHVFCLRTVAPAALSTAMISLPPAAWQHLEALLCPNDKLTPTLVAWFACFPISIDKLYRTPLRVSFERLVESIHKFLVILPRQWLNLTQSSKRTRAPPLAQDMADALHLTSPVLQTTVFRAIARSFWGQAGNKGMDVIESLHLQDQAAFFVQGLRRSKRELQSAYAAFAHIHDAWLFHVQSGSAPDNFTPPQAACSSITQRQRPPQSASPTILAPLWSPSPVPVHPGQSMHTVPDRQTIITRNHQRYGTLPDVSQPPAVAYTHPNQPLAQAPQPLHAQSTTGSPSLLRRFFPSDTDQPRPQPTHPDPLRSAMHQAHLRSPVPAARERAAGAPRLYRHVIDYAMSPTKIDDMLHAQRVSFTITEDEFAKIPPTTPADHAADPPMRILNDSSNLFRLRCCAIPKAGYETEGAWVTADNYWPDFLFLELNGVQLEPRRKLYHSRHLPVDLSSHVRPGENHLTLYLIRASTDVQPLNYAVAVEIIAVSTHDSILARIPTVSSADSLDAIKASLTPSHSGSANDPDPDELLLASSNLTVKLFDPYSACRIFSVPVRGATCLHRDCFDLDTFLSQCRGADPTLPTVVDCWRCPLCRSDVRPQTLVKDGFLMQVRAELEAKGMLDTRAIVVEADGSWKVKEERLTGVRSPSQDAADQTGSSLSRQKSARPKSAQDKSARQKAIEVIELD